MQGFDIAAIISVALLGSVSHCIGMCGGFVSAYSATKITENSSFFQQTLSHLFYNLGRVITYTVLGALLGFLGSVFTLSQALLQGFNIFVGLCMVLMGLSLSGKIKFLTKVEHSLMQYSWYQRIIVVLLHKKNLSSFFSLGLLNGLFPCGLVYFFAITATATGSIFYGALTMFIFGVSTIPTLFSLGFLVQSFKQNRFRRYFTPLVSLIIVIYGISFIYEGSPIIQTFLS